MSRLTKKSKPYFINGWEKENITNYECSTDTQYKTLNKLGQLEDLEEMLGFELLELFKEDFEIQFKRNDKGDIIGRSITFTRPTSPFSDD